MELSEGYIQKFEDEGFASVYEHQDPAGTIYEEHSHKGKVSIFVTDGDITFTFDGVEKKITAPARFDIQADTKHSAVVGPEGWIGIIGEEIEDDS